MENMNLLDKSKVALKSETWQELGEALREEIVKEYLKTRYTDGSKLHDIEVSGTTYKVLERGEITTFYDGLGNTLFDVENARLSVEAAKIEEQSDNVEKADKSKDTNNKQDNKAEDVKVYASGEEKLMTEENEMLSSVKPEFKKVMRAQMDLIFKELIGWTKQDPEFEKKVLLDHKSMKRCMKFCADKAMGLREPTDQEKAAARNNNIPIMTPVGSAMLFEWIKEYYDKDDKAEAEKEKKAASKETGSKKQAKKPVEKKEDKKAIGTPKKQDKFVDGQLSMFDLFGV